ncbi:ABC transporter substrate-binding protein [Psychrobacillus sp. MER TA 171]|uniref:ABC transporter substrate-binding protein n=1 Tax=Psychrobacillus sp. MER TA 171 TaxID=2939577 RepID=UPI00203EE63F|nr:ABC transporter substrate-binding protein [Psychrobacillus sp. MER TA 171]MCM3356393.1 ABC transporter substrate-binding protein [Psychrobacillus sp. MER TA 171]
MKKLWLIIGMTLLILGGCNEQETLPTEKESSQEIGNSETAFPLTLTDAVGQEITLEEAPTSIISMIPSNTEILFALGLDDEIIGVNDYESYPKEALEKEKIGGMEYNIEKIISLSPDIVFAHESIVSMAESGLQQLRDAGVKVYVVQDAKDFNLTYTTIEQIGRATGKYEESQAVIEDMKAKVDEIQEKVAKVETKKTVFVETSDVPEIYTPGNGTFMQEILTMVNAENIMADQDGWFQVNPEEIVSRNPDVMLITYDYVEGIVEKVKQRDGFDTVTAIQNDEVVQVDEDATSRPGPRLVEGLEEVAKAIYPEAFSE